jgi:hypothetical protein
MTVIAGERWAHYYRMICRGNEKAAAEAALLPQAAATFQREKPALQGGSHRVGACDNCTNWADRIF